MGIWADRAARDLPLAIGRWGLVLGDGVVFCILGDFGGVANVGREGCEERVEGTFVLSTSAWTAKGLEIKHSTAKEDSGDPHATVSPSSEDMVRGRDGRNLLELKMQTVTCT